MSEKTIGFGASVTKNAKASLKEVNTEDLLKYGLIPEFIGRVPIIVSLDALEIDSLVQILKEPKNSFVKQYQKLFELDGVKLTFEDDALYQIAKKAFDQKTGARGLRTIMENLLLDLMFEIPSIDDLEEVIVTKESVDDKEKLVYKKR